MSICRCCSSAYWKKLKMADLKVLLLATCLCGCATQDTNDSGIMGGIYLMDSTAPTEEGDVFDIDDVDDLLQFGDNSYYRSDVVDYANGDVLMDRERLRPLETTVIILYGIITIVGLVANAVVFFVIFAGNEMGKTVTAIYVLQLTIADTIFLFMLPIFSMQKVSSTWTFGSPMCTLSQTIKFLNYYAGIFFLTAMSVDRYVAVAYSTRLAKVRTKKKTYWVCVGVWFAAIVMSVPLILHSKLDEVGNDDVLICRVMFPGYNTTEVTKDHYLYLLYEGSGSEQNATVSYDGDEYLIGSGGALRDDREVEKIKYMCTFKSQPHSYFVWLIFDFLVGFVIPFLIIVAMYALILTHLRTAEQKIGHTATSKATKMRKRVTKMVASLVVCFTLCWLPHHLFMLAKMKGFESTVLSCHTTEEFFVALAFSNSALNPMLYTFMGNNFRERFTKSLKNTHLSMRRRVSSRSSMHKKSMNSHSDHHSNRLAALIVRYRKNSSNGSLHENSQNSKSNKCQVSLFGSKKDRSNVDINSGDGSEKANQFYGITSAMLENTMETHLETDIKGTRTPE